jgi:hypothetical protein
MCLSPYGRRGQSHFRGCYACFQGCPMTAAKIGTVPLSGYAASEPALAPAITRFLPKQRCL